MIELQTLALSSIVESTFNPRKNFHPAKLTELAESIKASGVLQPILVRSLPGERVPDTDSAVQFEIIAGVRRFRASQQAGVKTIPAIVRVMSDDAAMEAAILENLQREDLTELEEAEGYEQLMQRTGISADSVGSKIGKSRSYVYARLKLLDLSMECKEAMRAGQIDASRAILIARIPDTTLQTKALAEATKADWRGEVCSVRALQSWLQANVMLRLENASFRITDATLVKSAGSCKDCPKRTGANPDLFADVDGADICTDPICYHGKEDAQRTSMLATAEKKGMRLIEGTEAKEICHQYRDTLKGYSPLNQVRNDLEGQEEVQLAALLGKDSPPAVLIENPWTKELIAAVPTAEAEAVLMAKGLLKVVQQKQDSRAELEEELAALKKKTEREIDLQSRSAMFEALVAGIRALPDALAYKLITPKFLRAWLLRQVGEWDSDDFASWLAIDMPANLNYDDELTHLRLHLQACDSAKLYRVLAISMMEEDSRVCTYWANEVDPITLFPPMAEQLSVDLDTIKTATAADVKHDMAETMKRIKAELKALDKTEKSPAPLPPAAQAKECAGVGEAGADGKGKAKGKKADAPAAPASVAPLRKRKLSPDEAQAAIAAAMQEQDTDSGAAVAAQGIEAASGCALAVGAPPAELDGAAVRAQLGMGLAVGQRVKALAGKYKHKQGEVTKDLGEDCFSVKLKGVSVALIFRLDQLEVVPA
ncbi:MAG: ParB/RepB/Spo0J family partition protein [Aquabacterium sp.]|nr:ParB/RepB/Spo0J family partition protein [Aquabacterium sp.]